MNVQEAKTRLSQILAQAERGEDVVIARDGTPVARLVPEEKKRCTGPELAEALREVDLSEDEAKTWHRDLVAARKALKPPKDKWR